ncbi:hypothetical protein [Nitrosomonas sp. JL21]|nr:hypothetical protein [Nitrosomonas sp. JL21]
MCRPKEAHQSEKWCNALRLLHPTRDGGDDNGGTGGYTHRTVG